MLQWCMYVTGDDDYSQFGDYNSYDPQEEEEETFAFEGSFGNNQQQVKILPFLYSRVICPLITSNR